MYLLLTIAIIVVAVLSSVAVYLHWLIYKKNIKREQGIRQLQELQFETRKRNLESIDILLRALLQQQVTLTEASIRVSVLAESLALSEELAKHFSAFEQLASACSHIPILEQWKALNKKQQRDYEAERLRQESIYEPFVLQAAKNFPEHKEEYSSHIRQLARPG